MGEAISRASLYLPLYPNIGVLIRATVADLPDCPALLSKIFCFSVW